MDEGQPQVYNQGPVQGQNIAHYQQITQHFHITKSELTQPSPPEQVWFVPYRRNPFFTGREELLQQLHDQLTTKKAAALTQAQAISGLGGIGKSQIALEYAYRYRDEYHYVLWIQAGSQTTLTTEFAELARLLPLPVRESQDQEKAIAAVKHWLSNHEDWLLILDNADDLAMASDFLPTGETGHIILTSRAPTAAPIANSITVEEMDRDEAALLLLRRAKILATDATLNQAPVSDRTEAEAIAETLGDLPLALDQAGAYIEETGCSLYAYRTLFQTHCQDLLARGAFLSPYYSATVTTTWNLSFQKVEEANAASVDLLHLCAFLAPDAIPEELITKGAAYLGEVLSSVAIDPFKLNEAMEVLHRYSLIRRNPTTKTFSLHRLVQACIKDRLDGKTQQIWVQRAIEAINQIVPKAGSYTRPHFVRYFPHAQKCLDQARQWDMLSPAWTHLLRTTGIYLFHQGEYETAERLLQEARQIYEAEYGLHHLDVVECLNSLASLYNQVGKYTLAEAMYLQALSICEQLLGSMNQSVSEISNNLALSYQEQGKYEQAEQYLQRSIDIDNQTLDMNDAERIQPLSNLGLLYIYLGRYAEAAPLLERAIELIEHNGIQELPQSNVTYNNLAGLYSYQGKYTQAVEIYLQIIPLGEKTFGPMHPSIGTWYNNLARVYNLMNDPNKYDESEKLLLQAIVIHEHALGADHPLVAIDLTNLGHLYFIQGRYEQSESCHQRAYRIRFEALGDNHQYTAQSCRHLARLYKIQNKLLGAKQLYQRALEVWDEVLSVKNPDVITCRQEYIEVLYALKDDNKAKEQEKKLSQIDET